jgi:hypothetical protein
VKKDGVEDLKDCKDVVLGDGQNGDDDDDTPGSAATITVVKASADGRYIEWVVEAVDACGNTSTSVCKVQVVKPAKGHGDDDDDSNE